MTAPTLSCDHCGTETHHHVSLGYCEFCPKCAKTQLLYDAAHDALKKAQDQLIREWVAYWSAVGVPRDSLLNADPHLYSEQVIEATIEAMRQEVL